MMEITGRELVFRKFLVNRTYRMHQLTLATERDGDPARPLPFTKY